MKSAAHTAIPFRLSESMPSAASADAGDEEYSYPECVDDRGEAVVYLSTDSKEAEAAATGALMVAYAAARYLDPENLTRPAILYDKAFMDGISPILRDFTFAHEGFHLKSGDARYAYLQEFSAEGRGFTKEDHKKIERRANSDAAHDLREVYGYRVEDLDVLERDMRARMGDRHVSDTMPIIRACFANEEPRPILSAFAPPAVP